MSQSPNKSNIFYSLDSHQNDVEDAFAPLLAELKKERTNTDRTIIFCRTAALVKSSLGKDIFKPRGYPSLAECENGRYVHMHSSCGKGYYPDAIPATTKCYVSLWQQ